MPFPGTPFPPGSALEVQRSLAGEATLTLFSDEDLIVGDYSWTTTWFVSGTQDVPAIESAIIVKGGTPHPSVKGHSGGSCYGDNLNPQNGLTLTFPTYAAGDLAIVWACESATSTTLNIIGWTLVFSHTGVDEKLWVWAKILAGTEGATVRINSSSGTFTRVAAALAIVQDIHGGTVAAAIDDFDVRHDTVNTHLCTTPLVTCSVDGGLGLPVWCVDPTGAFAQGQFIADSKVSPVASAERSYAVLV